MSSYNELIKKRDNLILKIKNYEVNPQNARGLTYMEYQECNLELIEVTQEIYDHMHDYMHLIPDFVAKKCHLEKDGFRSVYNQFVAFDLNERLRDVVRNYPNAHKANCVLCYGYIDEVKGLCLEILAAGKKLEDGFVFYKTNSMSINFINMNELKDCDYYQINDDSEILRHRYEKQLAYLQCLEPLLEVLDTRYMHFLDEFRSEKHPDIVKVHLVQDGLEDEVCDVYMVDIDENYIFGELCHEPNQDFGYYHGDIVSFKLIDGKLISDLNL